MRRSGRPCHGLGCEVSAPNRAFHGGGPSRIGPVSGPKHVRRISVDRGPDQAGRRGESRADLFDYMEAFDFRSLNRRKEFRQLAKRECKNIVPLHSDKGPRSAHDQLQVFPPILVEHPLKSAIKKGRMGKIGNGSIEPDMHSRDRRVVKIRCRCSKDLRSFKWKGAYIIIG